MTRERVSSYEAPVEVAGDRLDQWLSAQAGAPTRSQIKNAADDERLRVDGKPVRASYRLRGGETVTLSLPEITNDAPPTGEAIDLDVLYEDDDILAVNKPPGMVVHPAAGNRTGTLVHALLHRDPSIAWPGQPERAGIVHRLDRDTSGVILAAKSVSALEALSKQFRERTIRKTYVAVVHGEVKEAMRIDAPIGRHPTERKKMSIVGRPARAAVSDVTALERFRSHTFVEVRPLTGRTHQIRVHLSSRGFPIVGDRLYGGRMKEGIERQALHAARIELALPGDGTRLSIEAPLAADIGNLLVRLRSEDAGRGVVR